MTCLEMLNECKSDCIATDFSEVTKTLGARSRRIIVQNVLQTLVSAVISIFAVIFLSMVVKTERVTLCIPILSVILLIFSVKCVIEIVMLRKDFRKLESDKVKMCESVYTLDRDYHDFISVDLLDNYRCLVFSCGNQRMILQKYQPHLLFGKLEIGERYRFYSVDNRVLVVKKCV